MAQDKSKFIVLKDYGITQDIIDDIFRRLDTKVTCSKERAEIVNKLVKDYECEFVKLMDKTAKELNTSDSLYFDTNISKFYETFANYIDNSDEARKMKLDLKKSADRDIEYSEDTLKDISAVKKGFYISKQQVIHKDDKDKVRKMADGEYKKIFANELKVTKKDGTVIYSDGDILTDYQNTIDHLVESKNKLKLAMSEHNNGDTKSYKMMSKKANKNSKLASSMRQDQIESKNRIARLLEFTRLTPNSSDNDWFSFIDYGKPEDVKLCLANCFGSLATDRGIINYDLNKLIDKCGFSQEDLDIMTHYRAGQTFEEISKDLDKSKQHVHSKLDTMCNKISRQHLEDRYDNIRINFIKGTYKRCNTCNQILFERDFYKNQCVCKSCHIKNVKSKQ